MKTSMSVLLLSVAVSAVSAREYHVSTSGNDLHQGTAEKPVRTISAAAVRAQPGDAITVHQGVYRERINPPRGGDSNEKRIVYQAAAGETVVIKGSEVIKGWVKVQNDTWKVTVPNEFFGNFNPYSDTIQGDWFNPKGRDHHTGAVYLNGHWLTEAARLQDVLKPVGEATSRYAPGNQQYLLNVAWLRPGEGLEDAGRIPAASFVTQSQANASDIRLWSAQVDASNTTIWAQFPGDHPNEADVEINVRRTVFYADKPGVNYITVSGLTLMHASTPWAPPTAEQIGLIGTHWSKGWIIEDCDIRYSTCVGITLGKHGDRWDNTSQNTAEGYVKTIERAIDNGWSKENIGHHVVRNNRISHCEQAGIVGSLGAVFSTISGNVIHDIHVRQLFTGAEMAGIKIHAAIDTEISGNHIYRTCRGIWLDWMAQGTRVTRNLLHDNNPSEDLFVEVNHGPFLIDNNLFLSPTALLDMSEGGAYVHNLFAGRVVLRPELSRETPYHSAHSTEVAGLRNIEGGDDRFFNNIFSGYTGLAPYDKAAQPMQMAGNVFLKGAQPAQHESKALLQTEFDPGIQLVEEQNNVYLHILLDETWGQEQPRQPVTTEMLGRAKVPDLPFEQPDGSPYRIDADYFGKGRNTTHVMPGPFESIGQGKQVLKVWDGSP